MRTSMASDSPGKGMNRRSFVQGASSAGFLALLSPTILAACSGSDAGGGDWNRKLAFMGWDFQPEIIQQLIDTWSSEKDVDVDVQIIPNVGYSAALQTRMRGGSQTDVYYNFAYNSQKFIEQGWAASLNDRPDVQAMLDEMFPSARERHVTAAGDVISVPYFSAVHMMHYNEQLLTDAGISGPPQSLQETYEQSKTLAANGTPAPYLGYWIKEFCEEYFNVYLLTHGVTPFGENGEPAFADDPRSEEVFDWWQTMYQEGLAPESVITDDPGKLSAEMAEGRGAFFVLHHYFLTSIRAIEGPHSANVMQAPLGGKTLQIGEVLQMADISNEEQLAAAWDLMKYYGWKDDEGKFSVFVEWAKAAGLAAPYPDFFTDDDVVAAFPDYYDLAQISQTFESGSDVVPARTLPWYPDFQAKVGDLVHALLLGQADAKQTVTALADAVTTAQQGGGL